MSPRAVSLGPFLVAALALALPGSAVERQYDFRFQSTPGTTTYWGPGASTAGTIEPKQFWDRLEEVNETPIDEFWSGGPYLDFGIKLQATAWAGSRLRYGFDDVTDGTVNVSFPGRVVLDMPDPRTYVPGQKIRIDTRWVALPGPELSTTNPSQALVLDARAGASVSASARACAFSCWEANGQPISAPFTQAHVYRLEFPHVSRDAREWWSMEDLEAGICHELNVCGYGRIPLFDTRDTPPSGPDEDLDGFDDEGFPVTYDWSLRTEANGRTLHRSTKSRFLEATMDLDAMVAGLFKWPQGFEVVIPENDYGVKAGLQVTNQQLFLRADQENDYTFTATGVDVILNFGSTVYWERGGADGGDRGTSSVMSFRAGDTIWITVPDHDMPITPRLTLRNEFLPEMVTGVDIGGTSESFRAYADVPSFSLGEICIPADPSPLDLWEEECVELRSPHIDEDTGWAGRVPIPTARVTHSGLMDRNQHAWPLPGATEGTWTDFAIERNRAPVAGFNASSNTPFEGQDVTFTNTSTDPDGDSMSHVWSFGDGSPLVSDITPTHRYAENGNYTARLDVIDAYGRTATTTQLIAVANVRPTVVANSLSVNEGTTNRGFTLFDPGVRDVLTVSVDWGDGTSEIRSLLAGGQLSHVYADDGTHAARVEVHDDDDPALTVGDFPVVVANVAPAISLADFSLPIERPLRPGDEVAVVASPAILFTDAGTADTHVAWFEWGDGSPSVPLPVTEVPHGPPGSVNPAAGRAGLRLSHDFTIAGTHVPRLCVRDDDGAETCASGEPYEFPAVDLTLTTAFTPANPQAGNAGEHALTVRNATALVSARGATVTNQLPPNTTIVGVDVQLSNPAGLADLVGARLARASGDAGDDAGTAVALDSTLALVGVPGADADAGLVLVFESTPGGWRELAELRAPAGPQAGDRFGASVLVDGSSILVGMPGAGGGQVIVFERQGSGWDPAGAPLTGPVGATSVGAALAVSANRLVVGAAGDALTRGTVLVFDRTAPGAPWIEWAAGALRPPVRARGDLFGSAVALVSSRLVVGAPGIAGGSGRAEVFDLLAASAVHVASLVPPAPRPNVRFGQSVAVDGDGVLIGAPGHAPAAGALGGVLRYGPRLDCFVPAEAFRLGYHSYAGTALLPDLVGAIAQYRDPSSATCGAPANDPCSLVAMPELVCDEDSGFVWDDGKPLDWEGDGSPDVSVLVNDLNIGVKYVRVLQTDGGILDDCAHGDARHRYSSVSINAEITDHAWGDVNGDGLADLAVSLAPGAGYAFAVHLTLRDSTGPYISTTPYWTYAPAGLTGRRVAWGDIDGDGDLDLAMAAQRPDLRAALHVARGEDGTLDVPAGPWAHLVSTPEIPRALSLDFAPPDASRKSPLAMLMTFTAAGAVPVGSQGYLRLYTANPATGLAFNEFRGSTSPALPGSKVVYRDISGDGIADVALSYQHRVSEGFAFGITGVARILVTGTPGALSLGANDVLDFPGGDMVMAGADADGDGDADLLLASSYWDYHAHVSRSQGGLTQTQCANLPLADPYFGSSYAVVWGEYAPWKHQPARSRVGTAVDALFGWSFELSGNSLAVGAPGANGAQGNVQLFRRQPDLSWAAAGALSVATGVAGDRLGSSLAFDGVNVLAGAPSAAATEGEAHAFQRCAVIGPGLLSCAVGTLGPSATATVSIDVLPHCSWAQGSSYVNEAWALASIIDPVATNHEKTDTLVTGPRGLACLVPDTTPPQIAYYLTGELGAGGWYRSDVEIAWEVSDPESSTVPTTTGCDTATITVDTDADGVSFTCSAESDGGTADRTVTLRRDTTPPAIAHSLAGLAGDAGWHRSPVDVSFTCNDALSGVVECPAPVTAGLEGINAAIVVQARDAAGNVSAPHVVSNIRIDTQPPTIVSVRAPANGAGWNAGDVAVGFGCEDATSGLPSDGSGCTPSSTIVSTEGAAQSVTCNARDVAGNVATLVVGDINVDRTPPVVTHVASGTPGSGGWYVSDVTLSFTCVDALSGLDAAGCPADVVLDSDGPDQGTTVEVADLAGNVATLVTTTVDPVDIDSLGPAITATISPAPYADAARLRESPTTLSFTCRDGDVDPGFSSGVADCPSDVVLTSGEDQTVTVEATDAAGNARSLTVDGINVGRAVVRSNATFSVLEGERVLLPLAEVDDAWASTGEASVDWGDAFLVTEIDPVTGDPLMFEVLREQATLDASGPVVLLVGDHVYADDGPYTTEPCVRVPTNADPEWICDSLAITVLNAPPSIEPIPALQAFLDCPIDLHAIFRDGGSKDTHEATVDWGDGAGPEDAMVTEAPIGPPGIEGGAMGAVTSSVTFATPGDRNGELCVTDDDGAVTCAPFVVQVPAVPPPMSVVLSAATPTCWGDTAQAALTAQTAGNGCARVLYVWSTTSTTAVITTPHGAPVPLAPDVATDFSVLLTELGPGTHQVTVHAVPEEGSGLQPASATVTVTVAAPCDPLSLACCDADLNGILDASSLVLVAPDLVLACTGRSTAVYPTSARCDEDGDGSRESRCMHALCDTDGDGVVDGDCTESTSACQSSLRWSFDPPAPILFASCGSQLVRVTVRDRCGRTATDEMLVTVGDTLPPVLTLGGDVVIEQVGCAAGTPYDVAKNVLSNTDNCAEAPVLETHGAPATFPLGATTVQLSSLDACGNESAPQAFQVMVENTPPFATVTSGGDIDEGGTLTVSAAARDPRSDYLRLTFSWGDGSAADVVLVDNPSREVAMAAETASHVYGDDGTFIASVLVEDDCNGTASWSQAVVVRNVAPVIDDVSVTARVRADLTLRIVGPEGVEDRDRSGPGPPQPVRVPGFEAQVHLFADESLVAQAALVEQEGVGVEEVTLAGLDLALGVPNTARVTYSTRLDQEAVAILELRFQDGTTRTARVTFPAPGDGPGNGRRPLDEAVVRTSRTSLNGLLPGTGLGTQELQATVRGIGDQLEEGVLTFELHEAGALLRQRQLDVAQALRDARHGGLEEFVLTLDPAALDPSLAYEGRLRYADDDESLSPGVARVGPAGSREGLDLAWPPVERPDRCDRHAGGADCTWWDWTADLTALLFGTPVTVTATGDDVGSDDLEFTWEWGDGGTPSVGLHFNDGLGPDPDPSTQVRPMHAVDVQEHRYSAGGEMPVTVTLRDDDGGDDVRDLVLILADGADPVIDEASLVVRQESVPPEHGHGRPRNDLVVELGLADADSDVLAVVVEWGDGESDELELRYDGDPADGGAFTTTASARHAYATSGPRVVRVRVVDDEEREDTIAFPVTAIGN